MARPKAEINASVVEEMSRLGCTTQEIADAFGCHYDTVRERFTEELRRGRANRNISIRKAQQKFAERGDSSLLRHLGVNYLDQSTDGKPKNILSPLDGMPDVEKLQALRQWVDMLNNEIARLESVPINVTPSLEDKTK